MANAKYGEVDSKLNKTAIAMINGKQTPERQDDNFRDRTCTTIGLSLVGLSDIRTNHGDAVNTSQACEVSIGMGGQYQRLAQAQSAHDKPQHIRTHSETD